MGFFRHLTVKLHSTKKSNYWIAHKYKKEFFCSIQYPISMKIMMFLGNDLIEAVPINVQDLRIPGYLGKFKRNLKVKYRELLQMAPEPPEFLVMDPAIPQQTPQLRSNT